MKRFVAALILLSIAASPVMAGSDNPLLLGKWKSDRALTVKYDRQLDKVNRAMAATVEQGTGHLVILFDPDRVSTTGATTDLQVDGMADHRQAHDLNSPYSIDSGDEQSIEVSIRDESSGMSNIMVFHFDDHDTMWVRAGGDGMRVADPRMRMYFRRVK